MANQMRLYQHSARCPIALRTFLDCNPNYWCFIPYEIHEAQEDNTLHFHPTSNTLIPSHIHLIAAMTTPNHHRTIHFLDRVPLPPASHTFSYRQIKQQQTFFQQLNSLSIHQLPYMPIDIYKMAMIAVCKYSFVLFFLLYHSIWIH